MKISIGRYRLRIGLAPRREPTSDQSSGDVQDRDLALLQNAEREYRDTAWAERSLLSGNHQW